MRHINLSLSKIVENVLNEDIVRRKKKYPFTIEGNINKAIDRKQLVTLYYDDRKGDKFTKRNPDGTAKWGNPRAYRKLIPYALYFQKI